MSANSWLLVCEWRVLVPKASPSDIRNTKPVSPAKCFLTQPPRGTTGTIGDLRTWPALILTWAKLAYPKVLSTLTKSYSIPGPHPLGLTLNISGSANVDVEYWRSNTDVLKLLQYFGGETCGLLEFYSYRIPYFTYFAYLLYPTST